MSQKSRTPTKLVAEILSNLDKDFQKSFSTIFFHINQPRTDTVYTCLRALHEMTRISLITAELQDCLTAYTELLQSTRAEQDITLWQSRAQSRHPDVHKPN